MTPQQKRKLHKALEKAESSADHVYQLALGYCRYKALRKLNPRQYAELHKRNLAGENFDTMVDELVVTNSSLT